MVDKRLFSLAPGLVRLVAGKVLCLWVSLLTDIGFAFALVGLLGGLFAFLDPGKAAGRQRITGAFPQDYASFLAAFVALGFVRYMTTRASAYFGTEAAERVKSSLRERLYKKMLSLGPSYSQHVQTSDVIQSAGEGIEQLQSFFDLFLPQLFFCLIAPPTLFLVLAPVSFPAAITLLACAPLLVIVVALVATQSSKVFRKYWNKYVDLGATFLDDLQGLETLKTFEADEGAAKQMDERSEQFRLVTMGVLRVQLTSLLVMDLMAYGAAAAGIAVACRQCASGYIRLPAAMVIILLSLRFFSPLRQLGSAFHVAMGGMVSSKRVFALLDAPDPVQGDVDLVADDGSVSVVFDDVSYAYSNQDKPGKDLAKKRGHTPNGSGSTKALEHVSFSLRPGHLTALVGPSGSGKSTAAALLAGVVHGYTGSLSLQYQKLGVPETHQVHDFISHSLIQAVTLVSARSHLFAGTLRDNLLMAKPDASDNDLWRALAAARIDEFIYGQPSGLDMTIDAKGSNLSEGQCQRVGMARALLHDSPIYIFDESTSSVDAESESLILAAIHELSTYKTVLMITHRLADVVDADHIIVFDKAHLVQEGSHESLMHEGGIYSQLYTVQERTQEVGHRQQAIFAIDEKIVSCPTASVQKDSAEKDRRISEPHGPSKPSGMLPLVGRLLAQVGRLYPILATASVCGTVGHLSASFTPVFGIFALMAKLGHPLWNTSATFSLVAMAVCAAVRGLMHYGEQYMNHNVAFRLLALFRHQAFAALRRLAPGKTTGKGEGSLIALVTTDVELLEVFFAHTISPVVIALMTTLLTILALAMLNPWFIPLLIFAHACMGLVIPRLIAGRLRGLGDQIRRDSSALDDHMLEDMRGLNDIIRFEQGPSRLERIKEGTRALRKDKVRLSRKNASFSVLSAVVIMLFTLLAGITALWIFSDNPFSAPESLAAVVLISTSFAPTSALAALPTNLTQTFAAARRMFALLDEPPAFDESGQNKPPYAGMALDDVSFSYEDQSCSLTPIPPASQEDASALDRFVLENCSLAIPQSGILGIQGPSGRGKSTILKLLMRYWDPQVGTVLFSSMSLPQVQSHYRHSVQTMLGQETYLFDASIRDNLLIANEQASDEELYQALGSASILDLIDSLPQGLDTQVGELGSRMSEGERQRLGLAGIFLRHATLVLFDEPTSRLDTLNDSVILQSINHLAAKQGTAIVLVSHRASTMRIADEVRKI